MIRSEQQNKMKFTLFAAFLFSIGWMSVVVAVGRPVPCCLTVSSINIRADYIVSYTIQDQLQCPIRAVSFHTKKNKVICSDRDNNWAKRVMKIVDGRKKTKPSQKPTMCYSSTTNIIPTVNTTNKTPGTETETSTSITVTPKVTTVKTSGPETSTSTALPSIVTTVKTSGPETSTSITVPLTVMTIKTSELETSTSTAVPSIVTTIKTSGPDTSTSTPIPSIVTTIKTSGPETSTSTPVPSIVTTIKTSGFSDGRLVDCCDTVTNTRIPVEKILHYDMQETNLCPARAVRFHTKKNITICSDPDSIWAKKAKVIVDGRTTIKTSGPETEINKTTIQPTSVSRDSPESSLSTATFTSSTTNDCCLAVTKNKPTFHEIVDYRVQETPLCSIRAVLFITVGNNKICSSPVEDWVQDYIQNLNRRKKTIDKREFAIKRIKNSNTNNYFCLKKEQSKYFCFKQP